MSLGLSFLRRVRWARGVSAHSASRRIASYYVRFAETLQSGIGRSAQRCAGVDTHFRQRTVNGIVVSAVTLAPSSALSSKTRTAYEPGSRVPSPIS